LGVGKLAEKGELSPESSRSKSKDRAQRSPGLIPAELSTNTNTDPHPTNLLCGEVQQKIPSIVIEVIAKILIPKD
jgi:hypothetical protein